MVRIYIKQLRIALIALFSLSLMSRPAQAIHDPTATTTTQQLALDHQSFGFIPPEDSGQPRTNRAGGRRNRLLCDNATSTPTPTLLIPPSNQGTTTATHPTFLAYLPQTSAQRAFLTLEDEDNNYLHHTMLGLPNAAGIVSFSISETAPALEPNKYYKVSLAMICGQFLDPNDPVIEGWIKRIDPTMIPEPRPSQETAFALGAWYARNGIWFDAVDVLADLRKSEPDNLDAIAAWEELLESVELESIQTATLLDALD